jgi:probable F420-dependent oxidoreductase
MLIDAQLTGTIDAADQCRRLASAGVAGLWVGDTSHDPFLQAFEMSLAAPEVEIGTAIAVAFARSPMTVAQSAYDLAAYSNGRFILGLGSQVRAHIERRFSMPWSHPAARMREFVLALRAIWTSWTDGDPLDFDGEFYRHTLMTPFFTPERHAFGAPPVYLAGVGQRMTEVAGEVADGFFMHAFTTPQYLREATLPALQRGRARVGKELAGFALAGPAFACVGEDAAELEVAKAKMRQQIAFYASTPAYRPVLDLHGWGDLQTELTAMSKGGRWDAMGDLIDDDVLHGFAAVGDAHSVGRQLCDRWSPTHDRITLYTPHDIGPDVVAAIVTAAGATIASGKA